MLGFFNPSLRRKTKLMSWRNVETANIDAFDGLEVAMAVCVCPCNSVCINNCCELR